MNISDRLRKERERLGLNQVEFGAIGGVKKLAQINYEKGERSPDSAYLVAIAAAGADVLYILTGQRTGSLPPMTMRQSMGVVLTAPEQEVVDAYRAADTAGRKLIRDTAAMAAKAAQG